MMVGRAATKNPWIFRQIESRHVWWQGKANPPWLTDNSSFWGTFAWSQPERTSATGASQAAQVYGLVYPRAATRSQAAAERSTNFQMWRPS